MSLFFFVFFFFQAEDGIRDVAVTGVQTCALPISFTAVRGTIPHRKTEDRLPKRTAGVAALDLLIKTSTLFSAFRRGWRYARTVGHTDIRQTQAPQSSRCGLIFEGNV